MADENKDLVQAETTLPEVQEQTLKKESLDLINRIIAESNLERTKDLTYLFNLNQNKKTMVRQNKLNDLLDIITDQAIERFSAHPEEIANQELFQGLKTVADMIERGQKQINGATEAPLIQINQQTNEVNVGEAAQLSRASRERVKAYIRQTLKAAGVDIDLKDQVQPAAEESLDDEPIEAEATEKSND